LLLRRIAAWLLRRIAAWLLRGIAAWLLWSWATRHLYVHSHPGETSTDMHVNLLRRWLLWWVALLLRRLLWWVALLGRRLLWWVALLRGGNLAVEVLVDEAEGRRPS